MRNLRSASLAAIGSIEITSCQYGNAYKSDDVSNAIMDAGTDGGSPNNPCATSSADVSIDLAWTGTGDVYRDRSTETYNTPNSRYRSTHLGESNDATVSGTLLMNGGSIDLSNGYGSLSRTVSGAFEIYR
jgi:hypothetical protein